MSTELREEATVDQVTVQLVAERWVLMVRARTRVMRGDAVIAETFHRRVLEQGDDLDGLPDVVRAVAASVWP